MNNPPAFPNEGFNGWGEPFQGMTLRDYFAAKVLQGMLASGNLPRTMPDADIAECSYNLADAMMKAREA
jgi:hypothetical protein